MDVGRWMGAGVVAAVLALVPSQGWQLPDAWKPWTPLRFEEAHGPWTRLKLARLSMDGNACRAFLDTTPLQWQPVPDRVTGEGCGFEDAVRITRTAAQVNPFVLSCRAAVSLALWERHVVRPLASEHFGGAVQRIEHAGSYACRNIGGGDRRSQHARADALDVTGFVLQDGRRVSVLREWPRGGAPAVFLRGVHDGACEWFDGVLGPAYNAAHADHFHLDRGAWRACR